MYVYVLGRERVKLPKDGIRDGGGGWGIRALAGCKENHFYSLPFGQAEASIY